MKKVAALLLILAMGSVCMACKGTLGVSLPTPTDGLTDSQLAVQINQSEWMGFHDSLQCVLEMKHALYAQLQTLLEDLKTPNRVWMAADVLSVITMDAELINVKDIGNVQKQSDEITQTLKQAGYSDITLRANGANACEIRAKDLRDLQAEFLIAYDADTDSICIQKYLDGVLVYVFESVRVQDDCCALQYWEQAYDYLEDTATVIHNGCIMLLYSNGDGWLVTDSDSDQKPQTTIFQDAEAAQTLFAAGRESPNQYAIFNGVGTIRYGGQLQEVVL